MASSFSGLCTPAMVYFVVSIIYLIFSSFTSFNIMFIIIHIFIIMLWSWFLNFLCKNGYSIIAWLIIVLPFFIRF